MTAKNAFSPEYVPVIKWGKDTAIQAKPSDIKPLTRNIRANISIEKHGEFKSAKIRRGGL